MWIICQDFHQVISFAKQMIHMKIIFSEKNKSYKFCLVLLESRLNKNSAEGVIAPAGAKVTGATIRMWLLNKFISFLAVLTWKTGLKKM